MLHNASKKDLDKLLTTWVEAAKSYGDEGVVFANDISGKISSLQKDIAEPNNFAYIFKDEEGEARAFLSIIHALPNSDVSWLKMLDLDLHPDLALGEINIERAGKTLFGSIFEPITLMFDEHKAAKELKIYGRTEGMRRLFDTIVKDKTLQDALGASDILVLKGGNWLVFRKK